MKETEGAINLFLPEPNAVPAVSFSKAVCGRQSVNIAVIIITACRRVHAAARKHIT
jgi:hypothetical protein